MKIALFILALVLLGLFLTPVVMLMGALMALWLVARFIFWLLDRALAKPETTPPPAKPTDRYPPSGEP